MKLLGLLGLLGIIFLTPSAIAASNSNDFSESRSEITHLTAKQLRERFVLEGEIFVSNADGVLLYKASESRMWRFGKTGDLTSNWSYKSNNIPYVGLRHEWSIGKDGAITASLKQYDKISRVPRNRDVTFGKLLQKKDITVKNFEPVTVVLHKDSKQTVVARLTPRLDEVERLVDVKGLPISLRSPVVYDSKGQVWAQGLDLEGRFVAMTTHKGRFAVSFEPFDGAKEIGSVSGNEIKINHKKDLTLFVRSEAPIITTQQPAKLYGRVDLDKRTHKINSVGSSSSGDEENFLKHLD